MKEIMLPGYHIEIITPKKVRLNGVWFGPQKSKSAIVWIHRRGGRPATRELVSERLHIPVNRGSVSSACHVCDEFFRAAADDIRERGFKFAPVAIPIRDCSTADGVRARAAHIVRAIADHHRGRRLEPMRSKDVANHVGLLGEPAVHVGAVDAFEVLIQSEMRQHLAGDGLQLIRRGRPNAASATRIIRLAWPVIRWIRAYKAGGHACDFTAVFPQTLRR